MRYFLFALLKRDAEDKTWRDTRKNILSEIDPDKEIAELGEGCWLLPEKKLSPFLSLAVSVAESEKCPFRVIVVLDCVDWSEKK